MSQNYGFFDLYAVDIRLKMKNYEAMSF